MLVAEAKEMSTAQGNRSSSANARRAPALRTCTPRATSSILGTRARKFSRSCWSAFRVRINGLRNGLYELMGDRVLFEYRAKLVYTPNIEEKGILALRRRGIIWGQAIRGKSIRCLIRIEIHFEEKRLLDVIELEQEARDIVLFVLNPESHCRISHSTLCEIDEERLRELGSPTDFHIVGNTEVYFYSS